MSKGKNFSDFTYGVGLDINATSFKQVKNDLKLNLDNLSKMVKSYGKVLKIDPNADLSKLFEEMRKIQGIVDGINSSDNSFAGFVDKGVLTRIASLETSLETISSTSKELESSLSGLRSMIATTVEPLTAAGSIKLPNFSEGLKNQAAEIKQVQNQIKEMEASVDRISNISYEIDSALRGNRKTTGAKDNEIQEWVRQFHELENMVSSGAGADQVVAITEKYGDSFTKLYTTLRTMGKEQMSKLGLDGYRERVSQVLQSVVNQLDDYLPQIDTKVEALEQRLEKLNIAQEKYTLSLKSKDSAVRSLGVAKNEDGSNLTLRAKIIPDTTASEWVTKINDTIASIEPQLKPVTLRPTFSKGKNITKEVEGNLSQINHAVNVDLKVDDNIEQFNEKIKHIDASIKNAKQQLEQNGNFKIKFEYEEGGKFKDAAYKIINKFKKIESTFYITNGKKFIQDVAGLRTKATKELKDIPANVVVSNSDSALSNLDTFRTEIEKKIGNIGVNLNIQNLPQFMAQAVLMRDAVEKAYNDNPVGLGIGPVNDNTGVASATKNMENLSDAAKAAQDDLKKCKVILESLTKNKFDAPEFLQLGDINTKGQKVKGSTKKLEELLNSYRLLQAKLPEDVASRWQELYPEASNIKEASDMAKKVRAELKQVEAELTLYLQKQIAYTQSRYDKNQEILNQEKEIVSVRSRHDKAPSAEGAATKTNEKLAISAEDASKKVKSLNTTLSQQKKVLEDLETNKLNAKSLVKLGEWDKETGSFKKNKQEMQKLVDEYMSLREARQKAGESKVVGKEAELRGKLSAILREQKKHVSEIISQNQTELESAKAIVSTYKDGGKHKRQSSDKQIAEDTATLTKNIENLTEKLNKARAALSSLKSDGLTAVGSTGLRDNKGVLKAAGITQNLKELVSLYNQLLAKKKEMEASGSSSQSIDNINKQIEVLANAKQLLNKKGFFGLTDTQIGDVKGRLGGDPKALETLISQYHQLLIAKKEFEKNGDTTSDSYIQTSKALDGATQQLKILHQDQLKEIDARIQGLQTEVAKKSEYIKITQECQTIEGLLADVHKNQVEYAQSRVKLYSEQLTKAQELLRVEQQRAQAEAQYADSKSKEDQAQSPTSNTGAQYTSDTERNAGVVKLDSATLGSLAKDGTLQSINEKVGNILSQLGNGLNITGSNISIEASNVSVTGGTTNTTSGSTYPNAETSRTADANEQIATGARHAVKEQEKLNAELGVTHENVENLSNAITVVNARTGEVRREVETYRTADRVSEKVETSGWVKHGKDEPATFEHVSTVYKTNMEAFNRLYQDFINALSKQQQIEEQITTADGPTSKLQAELEAQKAITSSLEAQLKTHEELYTQEAQRAAIVAATKKAQQEMAIKRGSQSDKDINKQNAELMKIVNSAQKKYDDMQRTMSNFKLPMADSAVAKFKEYEQLLTTLKIKQQEINSNPDLLKNESYSNSFDSLLQKMQKVQTEFTALQKSSEAFLSKIRSIDDIKSLESTFDPTNLEQMHDEMQAFANQVGVGSAKLIEFNDVERTATFEIKNGKGQVQQLTVAYDAATNSLGRYTSQTRESLSETQRFFNSLKHSFQNVARYVASFGSVYRLFAIIKQGFTYVRDIDSALTELKKVTDETDASYNQFLQDMSKTGKVVGATVQDLTTMASEWARLGYSMKEAGQLAESTAVLLNVSEFDDATKASEALISTMQAFKYTADESRRVVDVLNEVGRFIARR